MSAQLYLSRLVDEGRTDRVHPRSSLRTGRPTPLKRFRRARNRAH